MVYDDRILFTDILFLPAYNIIKVFFPCPNFIIHNMVTAFCHSRILSSAFYHSHFVIRHPPSAAIQSSVYRDHEQALVLIKKIVSFI